MKHEIIKNSFGRANMLSFILFGCFFLIVGILYLPDQLLAVDKDASKILIGICFLFAGILLISANEGVLLNPDKKTYKYYYSMLGLKMGLWKSYKDMPDLLMLRSKEKTMAFRENRGDIEVAGKLRHEIYLADKNHFNLVMIQKFTSQADAEHEADVLAEKLGLDWVSYNPGRRRPRRVLSGASLS